MNNVVKERNWRKPGRSARQDGNCLRPAVKWKFLCLLDSRADDVEKFLTEQKSMEDRQQALIEDLLKQKEAAMKDFYDKLAKLGYRANSTEGRGEAITSRRLPPSSEEKRKPKA